MLPDRLRAGGADEAGDQVPEAGAAGAAGAASVGTPSEITASPPQLPPAHPPTTSPPQLLQPPASPHEPQSLATSPHEPHSSTGAASPWQRAAFLAWWRARRPPWQRSRWWRPWQRWRPWQPWPATAPESPPTRAIATRAKNIATAIPRKRFITFLQLENPTRRAFLKPSRNNPDPGRLPDRSRRISCGYPWPEASRQPAAPCGKGCRLTKDCRLGNLGV